jgi:hypothetical protein
MSSLCRSSLFHFFPVSSTFTVNFSFSRRAFTGTTTLLLLFSWWCCCCYSLGEHPLRHVSYDKFVFSPVQAAMLCSLMPPELFLFQCVKEYSLACLKKAGLDCSSLTKSQRKRVMLDRSSPNEYARYMEIYCSCRMHLSLTVFRSHHISKFIGSVACARPSMQDAWSFRELNAWKMHLPA